jgi:hypothetical protein
VARVADGSWSLRHADALLDELAGSALAVAQREQVADLVGGRDSARTPWEIRQAARAAVLVMDPEAAERRYDKVKDDRSVTRSASPPTPGAWRSAASTRSWT